MKQWRARALFIFFCIISYPTAVAAMDQKTHKDIHPKHDKTSLLIKYKVGVDPQTKSAIHLASPFFKNIHPLTQRRAGQKKDRIKESRLDIWHKVSLSQGADLKAAMYKLKQDSDIEAIEFDQIYTVDALPNDPDFTQLWGLINTGQDGGTPGADINIANTWGITPGQGVVVAVIDTGVDYDHEDLSSNIWQNSGEIAGNAIDDDSNGYVDDIRGYDFHNDDADPYDDHYHGTHVAGTIAAIGNNNTGIVGVAWSATIMPLKGLGASGGTTSDLVRAIQYAVDNGADIINASWGGSGFSQALHDAISQANDAGVLFVASAGNSSNNNDSFNHYPSSYNLPNIIAVASTDRFDNLSYFSNWGSNTVDVAAPGSDIHSTAPNNTYRSLSGTSMASPHVSGAAALLKASDNALNFQSIKNLLISTAKPTIQLQNKVVSNGRINVDAAANCSSSDMYINTIGLQNDFFIGLNDSKRIEAQLSSCGTRVTNSDVSVSVSPPNLDLVLYDDGTNGDVSAGDGVYSNNYVFSNTGDVTLIFNASHTDYTNATTSISGTVFEEPTYTVDDQISYNWIDTSSGTRHFLGDDEDKPIEIGFSFPYFGLPHSELRLGSNGFITFGDYALDFINQNIPNANAPNNLVAVFWDDLFPLATSSITTQTTGVAPNRVFTATWASMTHYRYSGEVTFQISLYEDSGNIILRYQDVSFGAVEVDLANSATVGIENSTGNDGINYSYNTPSLSDQLAILFTPQSPPEVEMATEFSGNVNEAIQFNATVSSSLTAPFYTYRWNFGDGTTSNAANPSHVYAQRGVYDLSLIVNDSIFDSQTATAQAHVGPNSVPVANAGPDITANPDEVIVFNGTGSSDLDNDALNFRWDFGDNTTGSGNSPAHTYSAPGTYNVTLTVNDGFVDSAPDTAVVTINNHPPVAVIDAPLLGSVNYPIDFSASNSSDPNQQPLNYSWNFGDGNTSTLVSPTHTYTTVGIYSVALTVNDGDLSDSIQHSINVVVNDRPTADAGGPYQAYVAEAIQFNAAASNDPDGDTLTYYWEFGDGNTGTGVNPTYSYATTGTYMASLTVDDGILSSTVATAVVSIPNRQPVATISGPSNIQLGETANFDGSGSNDPDGDLISYLWDFGNGKTSTQVSPAHTYQNSGIYTVTLRVNDGDLDSLAAQTSIAVKGPPVADAGEAQVLAPGGTFTLDGSNSIAPGSSIVSYSWTQTHGANANLTSSNSATPGGTVPTVAEHWRSVATGIYHTCAIFSDGSLWCWGSNNYGQIGKGDTQTPVITPTKVVLPTPNTWRQVSASSSFTCGLDTSGAVWCWGINNWGQLGTGDKTNLSIPTKLTFPNNEIISQIDTGGTITCALSQAGNLYCWGSNASGQLGTGDITDHHTPALVRHPQNLQWASIDTSSRHTCAIDTSSQLWCWGANTSGQLGTGSTLTSRTPQQVYSTGIAAWLEVETGWAHTCGLANTGKAYCWGYNNNEQIGSSTAGMVNPSPIPVTGNLTFKDINAGNDYTCGIDHQEKLWCWGSNNFGKIGLGETVSVVDSPTAVIVKPELRWAALVGKDYHSCAIETQGSLWCWGSNRFNRINAHSINTHYIPLLVDKNDNLIEVELTVTDTDGASDSDTTLVLTNLPPVAILENTYSVTPGQTLHLSGALSHDHELAPITYFWELSSGETSTTTDFQHTFLTAGQYQVILTVNDGYVESAPATATINVVNNPPVADIVAPGIGAANYSVSFNGSGSSDPDQQPLNYTWDFGDGSTSTLTSPIHTYASAGYYTVRLTVSDGDLSDFVEHTIQIILNDPPTADTGGPYEGFINEVIEFSSALSSDPEGDTLSYIWRFGDGNSSTDPNPSHKYLAKGTYSVSLVVSDGVLNSPTATTTAIVPNRPPTAVISGPTSAAVDEFISLYGTDSSDPDGDTISYLWDFGDNTTSTLVSPSHRYTSAGSYIVTLTTDDGNMSSELAQHSITITTPPVADAGPHQTLTIGETIYLNGSGSSDTDGNIEGYSWQQTRGPNVSFVNFNSATPSGIVPTPGTHWRKIAPGLEHTCAVASDTSLWCWGSNEYGQIGIGSPVLSITQATKVTEPSDTGWIQVTSAFVHSCGVRRDGTVWCWGSNGSGNLGNTGNHSKVPVQALVPPDQIVDHIASSVRHNCAITEQQKLFCWGDNYVGQLGNGFTVRAYIPTEVSHPGSLGWIKVATGINHSCAIDTDNQLWCWGSNSTYQVNGLGNSFYLRPQAINAADVSGWKEVDLGYGHSCAISDTDNAYCWGDNFTGRTGTGSFNSYIYLPTQVSGNHQFKSISAGTHQTCAVDTGHHLWCWGNNARGRIGLGNNVNYSYVPQQVINDSGRNWHVVNSYMYHTCAIEHQGSLWCTGVNDDKQIIDSPTSTFYTLTLMDKNDSLVEVELTVTDDSGATASDTTRIYINTPPVAGLEDIIFVNLGEQLIIDGSALSYDHEHSPLSYRWKLNNEQTVTGSQFQRVISTEGNHQITLTVNDGYVDSPAISRAIHVNIEPQAIDDQITMNEDVVTTLNVVDNDVDDETSGLSISSFTTPNNGTLTLQGQQFNYRPDLDFSGSDQFSYTIRDSGGLESTASVTLTVLAMNDLPVPVDQALSTEEDNALSIGLEGSDIDSANLTFSIFNDPQNGSLSELDSITNSVVYTPNANFNGIDEFTFRVHDGQDYSAAGTITIAVSGTPDDPIAVNDSYVVIPNQQNVTGDVFENDFEVDDDVIKLVSHTQPQNGISYSNNDGTFTYIPNEDYVGTDSFVYTIEDSTGATADGTVELIVAFPKETVLTQEFSLTIAEDDSKSGTIPDLQLLQSPLITVDTSNLEGNFEWLDKSTGSFEITPKANWHGEVSLDYVVVSDNEVKINGKINLAVTEINDPPIARPDSYTGELNTKLITGNALLNDSDVDLNKIRIIANTQPEEALVHYNGDGTFTIIPNDGFIGTGFFEYTIEDHNDATDTAQIHFTIQDPVIAQSMQPITFTFVDVTVDERDDSIEIAVKPDSVPNLDITISFLSVPTDDNTVDNFEPFSGELNWTAGDDTEKMIEITIDRENPDIVHDFRLVFSNEHEAIEFGEKNFIEVSVETEKTKSGSLNIFVLFALTLLFSAGRYFHRRYLNF